MTVSLDNVQKVGYGLMNFTWVPSRKFTQEQFDSVLAKVIDDSNASSDHPLLLNGGEFYGVPERHENLKLLGKFFSNNPNYADRVYLSIKGGADDHWAPDTRPEFLKKTIDVINEYLQPLYAARSVLPKKLDMFTLCRVGNEPIEDTMRVLQTAVKEQGVESLCLSEVSRATLERAIKICPVQAIEVEFSLFHREPKENGLFEVCVRENIPVVCYSPLGKGLLAGQKPSDLAKDDMRHNFDKFSDPTIIKNNQILVDKVESIAKSVNLSSAQVAISWITSLSGQTRDGVTYPHLVPIPGSTNPERQLQNLDTVDLGEKVLAEIDETLASFHTAGHRYNKLLDQANYK